MKEVSLLKDLIVPNKLPEDVIGDYLRVNYFDDTEGLDEEVKKSMNFKISFVMK
jgi:hypothetical protein